MKTLILILISCLLSFVNPAKAHISWMTDIDLYHLEGSKINAFEFGCTTQPKVIFFWNNCDFRNMDLLGSINEDFTSNLRGKNVRVIGIFSGVPSVIPIIKPVVLGKGFEIEIYIDKNSDLKRALNIPESLYTFVNDDFNISFRRIPDYQQSIAELIYYCLKLEIAGAY